MTFQQNTHTVTITLVILGSPTDWDKQIKVIKSKAIAGKIWKFVDLYAKKEDLPVLQAPNCLYPTDIDPTKTQFSQLDENEKEEL